MTGGRATTPDEHANPWPALWALVIGFFMILVDSTIVSVATPELMRALRTDVNGVMWVTSAYLLAYAVPLLITGRLGDRFGPRRLYLTGLVLFTLASLACGLSQSLTPLVLARVAQGLGASLMTPQTMTVITRTFPAGQRGTAMALWGATAGVATLVGPLLGGLIVDTVGWEWIFFVNVPVGVIGFVLAHRLVPALVTHSRSLDVVGLVLSGTAVFLFVFGIQEGEKYAWGAITGWLQVWHLLAAGAALMTVFVWWQGRIRSEPLVPLGLFRDRNFSLSAIAILTVGFAITAMMFPLMIWAQTVRGLSPVQAALLMAPMAVLSGVFAPVVGRRIDLYHPRTFAATGIGLTAVATVLLGMTLTGNGPVWVPLLPSALLGVSNACMWGPLATTATRNLPMQHAGAASGVYNTTRQLGAVLGSAAIAVMIEQRLAAHAGPGAPDPAATQAVLPPFVRDGFSLALEQSLWLPAAVLLVGVVATLAFERPAPLRPTARPGPPPPPGKPVR